MPKLSLIRKLFGHKEAALTLMIAFLYIGLVGGLWIGFAAYVLLSIAYIAAAEPPQSNVWSCTRDHRTTPCGSCDGCRYDRNLS